jgi:hypothetical protein
LTDEGGTGHDRSKAFLLSGIAAMIGLMAFAVAPRFVLSSAQNTIAGQWIVSLSKADGFVQLTLRSTGPDWNINSSTSFPLSQLRGLTAAGMRADGGMARFEIVRDAGTLQCEGWFKNGRALTSSMKSARPARLFGQLFIIAGVS